MSRAERTQRTPSNGPTYALWESQEEKREWGVERIF